jgi:hypothetical protein
MLPLVRDTDRHWPAGWCSYTDGFTENPDIEVFCGGENEKTARAAACWRQGNLLHFGFEQSPAEMSEAGQRLLLNCIAYISGFTEDQPIAITPSVFAGSVAEPRGYLDRRLGLKGDISEANWLLTSRALDQLKGQQPDQIRKWYASHRPFFHPASDLKAPAAPGIASGASTGPEVKLEVDEEALSLGAPLDRVEFFSKTVAALARGGDEAHRAASLLARYAPDQHPPMDSATAWEDWLKANRPYLFFSDAGDYRWYVDPLAKKRGVPSAELRGPRRASVP